MNDMTKVIEPRSDQLNADDMIAGPITITITRVDIRSGTEQPVSVFFDGDNGKPYKPCKSMCRALVLCWGADANRYVGRSMTLYRDADVKWAGMAVGGIRISHMSHIDGERVMMLTATKGSRKPHRVLPLEFESDPEALGMAMEAITAMCDKESCAAARKICEGLRGNDVMVASAAYKSKIAELKGQKNG
jgi:hypothetical protein